MVGHRGMGIVMLALAGCAVRPPAPQSHQEMALPPPPPPVPAEIAGPGAAPVIGTQLVGPETDLGPVPTLTLILKSGDAARNARICAGFSAVATAAEAQAADPNGIVIPLRWPMVRRPTAARPDCDRINDDYDFFRAGTLIGGLAASGVADKGKPVNFSGRGPFLIEQFVDANGLHYLLIDLSKNADDQFGDLGARVQALVDRQVAAMTSNAALLALPKAAVTMAPDDAAAAGKAAAEAKANGGGWLHRACGVAKSPLVKVLQILAVAVFPPALAVTTPFEAAANAGCAEPKPV